MSARRMVTAVGWAAAGAVMLRGVTGTRNVVSSLAWLTGGQPSPAGADAETSGPHFVLIVPMLREQGLIGSTTARFTGLAAGWGEASVALVTTEREHAERRLACGRLPELAEALSRGRGAGRFLGVLPQERLDALAGWAGRPAAECLAAARAEFDAMETTPALAARLACSYGGQAPVRHYHLPDPGGVMADQVNYAAHAELDRLSAAGIAPERVWLAVYNADSSPHPQTLVRVAGLFTARPDAQIIQQSAMFTHSLGAGIFADGAALLQSRWTLAREVPRLRRQSAQARAADSRAHWWPRLAHCVGHGLFVRGDVFTRLGGLPTATMNEDLAFGYLACTAGVPIDPLPTLEFADSPRTVAGVIRQTRQWFWSYPEYPWAGGLAVGAGLGSRWSRAALTAQGLARGALWLARLWP